MTWREYHESTKHSVKLPRLAEHVLDWANVPEPFRHYEGVPGLIATRNNDSIQHNDEARRFEGDSYAG
jgi:hypothetical protein